MAQTQTQGGGLPIVVETTVLLLLPVFVAARMFTDIVIETVPVSHYFYFQIYSVYKELMKFINTSFVNFTEGYGIIFNWNLRYSPELETNCRVLRRSINVG
jgi:hypothetical protein